MTTEKHAAHYEQYKQQLAAQLRGVVRKMEESKASDGDIQILKNHIDNIEKGTAEGEKFIDETIQSFFMNMIESNNKK